MTCQSSDNQKEHLRFKARCSDATPPPPNCRTLSKPSLKASSRSLTSSQGCRMGSPALQRCPGFTWAPADSPPAAELPASQCPYGMGNVLLRPSD